MAITTGSIPKSNAPGVRYWFGRAYNEHTPQYTDLFDMDTSKRGWEEIVELTGFGLVPVKSEGTARNYYSETQGYNTIARHVSYGAGFIVSREARDDDLYAEVGKTRAQALAFSFRQTKERVAASVYNLGFSTSYPIGDGAAMLSASHPCVSGNQSNMLATATDLSEDAIEDLCVQIYNAQNSRGHQISLMPQSLHVSTSDYFEAVRILESTLRSGTANNDKNVLSGKFPGGIKMNVYFSDSDAWFIRTNCPVGMKLFQRTALEFDSDNDTDTDNERYWGFERYIPVCCDWRSVYGSAGA